jgi:hypothetical protein
MFDVHAVIQSLAKERPLFHSEADFQHSLAWEIHKQAPNVKLQLEVPFRALFPSQNLHKDNRHVDILVRDKNQIVGIELKYITREWSPVEISGEMFAPKQGARGRQEFIEDISRLEELVRAPVFKDQQVTGYAVLLTCYTPYWQLPKGNRPRADMDLHEGLILRDSISFKRKKVITKVSLQGCYPCLWRDYNEKPVSNDRFGRFRYLIARVVKQEKTEKAANQRGVASEVSALDALRERFPGMASLLQPRDEWERGLLESARDWGVSLPDSALSSEGLYD